MQAYGIKVLHNAGIEVADSYWGNWAAERQLLLTDAITMRISMARSCRSIAGSLAVQGSRSLAQVSTGMGSRDTRGHPLDIRTWGRCGYMLVKEGHSHHRR